MTSRKLKIEEVSRLDSTIVNDETRDRIICLTFSRPLNNLEQKGFELLVRNMDDWVNKS